MHVLDDVIIEDLPSSKLSSSRANNVILTSTEAQDGVVSHSLDVENPTTLDEEYHKALDGSQYDLGDNSCVIDDYVDDDDIIYLVAMRHVVEETPCTTESPFSELGTSAIEWELTQLHAHQTSSPGAVHQVDNAVVCQLLESNLQESTRVTHPGINQGTGVSPASYQTYQLMHNPLLEQVSTLQDATQQLHGNLLMLFHQLTWAHHELLDIVTALRTQTEQQVQMHVALDLVTSKSEPYDSSGKT